MAPEILNEQFYDYKVDIGVLGVSMFKFIVGLPRFYGKERKEELMNNINKGTILLKEKYKR